MSFLQVKEVTNLYLYGQLTTPINLADDQWIRPEPANWLAYDVNLADFMNIGAGRFAVGGQFDFIGEFLEGTSLLSSAIAANTTEKLFYTKEEIFGFLGIANSNNAWEMQQYDFQDATTDYAQRVYLYNSMTFQISDDTKFFVSADGTRHIDGFGVIPRIQTVPDKIENFDFDGDGLAIVLNEALEPQIDPSGIGHRVDFNFTGDANLVNGYNLASYQAEQTQISSWGGFNPAELALDGNFLIDQLWNAGVTKFLDADDRPVLYGSNEDDVLAAGKADNPLTLLGDYTDNGVVLIAGDGDDTVIGAGQSDKLSGDAGNDLVIGSDGSDSIAGGAGHDTIYGGNGDDEIGGNSLNGVNTVEGGLPAGDDKIYGDNGNDSIFSGEGNDSIWGGTGDDQIVTYGDSDFLIYGGEGVDSIWGGDGNDTIYDDGDGFIIAEGGNDLIFSNGDTIGSTIWGGEGNDTIYAGVGDTVYAGEGDDLIYAREDSAILLGLGNDTIVFDTVGDDLSYDDDLIFVEDGELGNNTFVIQPNKIIYADIYAEGGNGFVGSKIMIGNQVAQGTFSITDSNGNKRILESTEAYLNDDYIASPTNIEGLSYVSYLSNESGNVLANIAFIQSNGTPIYDMGIYLAESGDTLNSPLTPYPTPSSALPESGTDGGDSIGGTSGDDVVNSGAGNDTISGGSGNDILNGGEGSDSILGGDGDDQITADDTSDIIGGDDTVYSGNGDDYVSVGKGNDSVNAGAGDDVVYGDDGDDILRSGDGTDVVYGASGNDYIKGDDGNDFLFGGDGLDTIFGGKHDDVINGGAGDDTINGQWHDDTIHGNDGNDVVIGYTGDDVVYGDAGDDKVYGASGNDTLYGGDGNDFLSGYNDDDILDGGAGRDILFGGAGADIFAFSRLSDSTQSASDRIKDFEVGVDNIDLSGLGFTGLDTDGGGTEAGELRIAYSSSSDRTYVRSDQGDFDFFLNGDYQLTLTDNSFTF